MIDDLYNMDVLALAAGIEHTGALKNPTGTSRRVSKLCGSWVEVDVVIKDGKVADFAIRLQACALGQAAAAILAKQVIGASRVELLTARNALKAMLKENSPPPKGRFAQLGLLADVKNYPARHASTLLAFEAAVEAANAS